MLNTILRSIRSTTEGTIKTADRSSQNPASSSRLAVSLQEAVQPSMRSIFTTLSNAGEYAVYALCRLLVPF